MTDFVHLHVHSDYSLQDASVATASLAAKAAKLGMKALALTDHGNMFGAMEFLAACEANNIKPIIGCEVYVAPASRFDKKGAERENWYYHLILLAANRQGYFNLIKLCSLAYTEGFYYRPRIDDELLAKYSGGLIALSACVSGEIPSLVNRGKRDEAEVKARYYRDLFGKDENGEPNFYLEIQDHGIPAGVLRNGLSQKDINTAMADIARRNGIPLAVTNDVHYLDQADSVSHDILLCIGTGKLRTEERRKRYYGDQFYLKSADEMAALFGGTSDYEQALANTVRIAERCSADIPKIGIKELLEYLPEFEIPAGYKNADDFLRQLTRDGLAKRYPKEKAAGGKAWEDIEQRAEFELDTIINMSFSGYFLIVSDFINWAKERDIPVGPGRGSGAGSIVAYALRITDIEPLKYRLLFERFLNPDRVSMPDFDVDFANEGREAVIQYVTEKYGRQRVGQIITFGTLGAKAVIKDVARALNISIPESEMITKLIPAKLPPKDDGTQDTKVTLQKVIAIEPKLQDMERDPRYTELFALAKKLEGLNRHSSIHAAGVVIGKTDLNELVPLYRDPKTGGTATQYDMNFLEKCGLVKMDFLGIKTLDVIKHTTELIRQRGGEFADFNVENAPEDDEATFKMLGEGKSFSVFQFESDGMQNVLKRAKPTSIEDLIALNSLYRPGPMQNINQFVDSKNGRQAISYPHPDLEDVLKETYGVIIYQEQVMQVAQIIAGYSMGQADMLRRAMGKKKKEILEKEKIPFLEGAAKQGYSAAKAGEIYDILVPFAGYGFNKSHAAGYSVLAYRTAYLKANFPAEFMAANLTNGINATDKDELSQCIAEARKMGLEIDPPDINSSDKLFTVVDGRIFYGLLGIKGLGESSAEEIVNCRRSGGEYQDFMDFLNRVDIKAVGKSIIERLILTGAFDRLGKKQQLSRQTLVGNFERAIEYAQNIKDDKKFGQTSLFGETGEKEYPDFQFDEFPDSDRAEKLKTEKELIGFYFSGHPMDEYREIWEKVVKVDLGREETLVPGTQILAGLIKSVKTVPTRSGDKMAFATLQDYNGEIELTFFPNTWKKCQDKIEAEKVTILKGKIDYQKEKDKRSFNVDEYLEIGDAEQAIRNEEMQARKWDKYRNIWKYAKDLDVRLLDTAAESVEPGSYTAIGVIKSLRTHIDSKGKEMAFGTIQDWRGEFDVVFFSRTWENCKAIVTVDETLALKGTVESAKDKKQARPSLMVSSIQDLSKLIRAAAKKAEEAPAEEAPAENSAHNTAPDTAAAIEAAYREIHIRLDARAVSDSAALYSLKACIDGNPGHCPVFIHVPGGAATGGTAPNGAAPRGAAALAGETVIRIACGVSGGDRADAASAAPISALAECAAVADVWGSR